MKNIRLLFEQNGVASKKIKLTGNSLNLDYTMSSGIFNGDTIRRILSDIYNLKQYYPCIKIPINLYFGKVKFEDKLCYMFLECICYGLIYEYGHRTQIYMSPSKAIGTEGIYSSPLLLINGEKQQIGDNYKKKFSSDIRGSHFRKVIEGGNAENYLGVLLSEVNTFLKPFEIEGEYAREIAEVIVELAGNSCEHAGDDCLIDIDITSPYSKIGEENTSNRYHGINIAILNLSEILLGDAIKNNIILSDISDRNDRYKEVLNAYGYHNAYFNDGYTETDFYNITAFQHKISGRKRYDITGGTGLTKLLKSLAEKSDASNCYVISGDRCVMFKKEFLGYNKNHWVGFNKSKNYISDIPEKGITCRGRIFVPGTGYNLNFVWKGQ